MGFNIQPYGIQSMLKEGHKHLSGLDEAVLKNIDACKQLSTITRTSLGPNGMNKMVINHLDKLFVTNDAATIVNELEVQHPAAKVLVLAGKAQQEEIGDGANLTISFAGELLQGAEVGRRDESVLYNSGSNVGQNLERREGPLSHSPKEAIKMIDKDKLKAALVKRRKERGEMTLKKDVMDEDDLIERALEDGVELAVEDEKNKRERRQNWAKHDGEDHHGKSHEETRDGRHMSIKGQFQKEIDEDNAEEGEMIDDASSSLNNRKRRVGSPPGKQPEMKKRLDSSYHNDLSE